MGINQLIGTGAKDDNGVVLPGNIGSGQTQGLTAHIILGRLAGRPKVVP
jgi:hypothetical protein